MLLLYRVCQLIQFLGSSLWENSLDTLYEEINVKVCDKTYVPDQNS